MSGRQDPDERNHPAPSVAPALPAARNDAGAIRTMVFIEVENRAEMLHRFGEERARAALEMCDRCIRAVLEDHGVPGLDVVDGGFLAAFRSTVRALEFAADLQRVMGDRIEPGPGAFRLRIGIHAGTASAGEDTLLRTTKDLVARVAGGSSRGPVLVADSVRRIVTGKGFMFAERRLPVSHGPDEPMRIWELLW